MNFVKTSLGLNTSATVALQDPTERTNRLKTYRILRSIYILMACVMLGTATFSLFVFLAGNSPLMIALAVMFVVFSLVWLILFLFAHIEVKIITLYTTLAQDQSAGSEK
jgi:hypothetical protein